MPTSPEAASVVERIHAELNYDGWDGWEEGSYNNDDIRALLAVVEAAKPWGYFVIQHDGGSLARALDALYTPDSAEEPKA